MYSRAGKIAQQKHPWLGRVLGKKYGPIQGKINAERLKGNSDYFSKMAKRLYEINPKHSSDNMRKAHATMKKKGTFIEHQRKAALKCMEKNPGQLKDMSKVAHKKYSLALLALESKRRNYPYRFMDCSFDSNEEMIFCEKLVEFGLIERPIEGLNVHFRIGRSHVDFFIQNRIFIEYHPPRRFGRVIETEESYYGDRRSLLNTYGFRGYPLIVVSNLREAEDKLVYVKKLIQNPGN